MRKVLGEKELFSRMFEELARKVRLWKLLMVKRIRKF